MLLLHVGAKEQISVAGDAEVWHAAHHQHMDRQDGTVPVALVACAEGCHHMLLLLLLLHVLTYITFSKLS